MRSLGTVYEGTFFETTLFETRNFGEQTRRPVSIVPAIAAEGWPVLLVKTGRFTELDARAGGRILPYSDCWRIVKMIERRALHRICRIRCENDGSTLSDLSMAIADGSRDYDVMQGLRIDFGLTSAQLLEELDWLAEHSPPREVQMKILENLRAFDHINECYEDCLDEFKNSASTHAA